MNSRNALIALSLKYGGDWDKIYRDVLKRESPEDIYMEQVEHLKCETVTMIDLNYPLQLRMVDKPPFVLFYYGDLSILGDYRKNISVVGSRENSEYGEKITKDLVSGLAKRDFTIISGMAIGIDTIAHQTAIDNGGKTVAVLGCGIDYCYPKSNEELYKTIRNNHLVISEYAGNKAPEPTSFPIRNRIIAGLSKTLIVTEAGYRSGSLITATLALMGNADVMCVPHPAGNNSGCNRLIMNGAYLVESVEDVLNQMSAF